MMRRDRTIICVLVAAVAACSASKKELENAQHSQYDADFAVVYEAALEATRNLYPNLDDNPGPGKIATAWHQVLFGNNDSDSDLSPALSMPGAAAMSNMNGTMSPAAATAGMPTQLASKRYFVRFDITIAGGRPWRVKVVGHASEWEPGAAMPVEMHGANRPRWLDPRIQQLQLAIYRRIKQYARPAKDEDEDEPKNTADELPKTDPSKFHGVPAGAAKRLAELTDTLARRAYASLRPQLADDVVWSTGGGAGADAAMAIWQADPAQLDAMAAAIGAGCGLDGAAKVQCPATPPAAGSYQLVIEPRGPAWLVTSFVKAE